MIYERAILEERFEAKYIPEPNSGCWLWLEGLDKKGYAWMRVSTKRMSPAYRVGYFLKTGEWSNRLRVLDHVCRNRMCVNPDHLELVTQKINILRGFGTGAQFARRTHCKNGHPFIAENVAQGLSESRRRCLLCRRAYEKSRSHLRKRAKHA